MSKIYTCEEIAERYSVQISTVWKWIKQGRLEAFKIGRLYRVKEEDLKKFEKASAEADN